MRAASGGATEAINPLQPYFLVYVLDDGNVRFGFAHPKQILDIYRILCSGKGEPYTQLCNLFDQQTNHGTTCKRRCALCRKPWSLSRRHSASVLPPVCNLAAVLSSPNAQEQVHDKTDLELVTWLVIKPNHE